VGLAYKCVEQRPSDLERPLDGNIPAIHEIPEADSIGLSVTAKHKGPNCSNEIRQCCGIGFTEGGKVKGLRKFDWKRLLPPRSII
jgi:hypothetical protein